MSIHRQCMNTKAFSICEGDEMADGSIVEAVRCTNGGLWIITNNETSSRWYHNEELVLMFFCFAW